MDILNTPNGPAILGANPTELATFEKQSNVTRAFKVSLFCAKCKAEMEMTNQMIPTYPPKVQYICPVCKNKITSKKMYPYIDYEFEGEAPKKTGQILV